MGTYFKIVESSEVLARIQNCGIELHWLRTGVTGKPEKNVPLNLIRCDGGAVDDDVGQSDSTDLLDFVFAKHPGIVTRTRA